MKLIRTVKLWRCNVCGWKCSTAPGDPKPDCPVCSGEAYAEH